MVILLRESWEYEERTAQARYMARRRRISSHATPLRHTIDGFALSVDSAGLLDYRSFAPPSDRVARSVDRGAN